VKNFFFFLFSLNVLSNSDYNSHGHVGYINTPSAYTNYESSLTYILSRDDPDRKLVLLASPFNWLDASLFYVDITGKPYGPGSATQSYKDKGFSIKFNLLNKKGFPKISLGGNDIAGTGIYNSEYIVLSDTYKNIEYSFGLGWGDYSSGLKIGNPLIKLNDSFRSRSENYKDRGGAFDLNNYFSGDMSLFGAFKIRINNDVSFLTEYDPTTFENTPWNLKPKTKINLGVLFSKGNLNFKANFIGGNRFAFNVSYHQDFLQFNPNSQTISSNISTYEDLQKILELNNIGLKSISEDKDQLTISVKQNSHTNQQEVNNVVYLNSKLLSEKYKKLGIVQETLGMEVVKVFYPTSNEINLRNETYFNESQGKDRYFVQEKFPLISNYIYPTIRPYIAAREGFIFSGLILNNDLEVAFKENIIFLANFKSSLYDDFDKLYIPPVNIYPNQVRSDIKKYYNNFDYFFIGRLELNFLKSWNQSHFIRTSVGYYEEMFGGFGSEYLYHPPGSLFSIGAEIFHVKKRDYKMNLSFKEYENTFARTAIKITDPLTDINLKVSYGEYLAGDIGFTYELSRKFDNGIEFGVFFSDTNVTSEQFGEGSFDKGVKLTIPFSSLLNLEQRRLGDFIWRPLTKDPAAMLIKSIDIWDEVGRFRRY